MADAGAKIWLEKLRDERDGAALYEGLAKAERSAGRSQVFASLAAGERRHAELWAKKLAKAGVALPKDKPSARVRALIWMARRPGTASVVSLVMDPPRKGPAGAGATA